MQVLEQASMSCAFSPSCVIVSDASAVTADLVSQSFHEGQLILYQTCNWSALHVLMCSGGFAIADECQLVVGLLQFGGCIPRCSAAAPLCD